MKEGRILTLFFSYEKCYIGYRIKEYRGNHVSS